MFKKENRYVTRGVSDEVDIRLQLAMWTLIDILKDKGKVEIDYLQIFKLKKENRFIKIQHEQEIPKYKSVHMIDVDDIQLDNEVKIYVIDSEEYSTMLYPSEY
ncbi:MULTISPECIES: DUF960 family protein [Clostridium]|jgi:hypothetical protein|uniref:DUF960 domain-containing protein n=1 Tax=Clostridium faecium TaxID=2762223 RepID=A0ABR8YRU6_9CLOT|nr:MULTISPECIES: DUF960 family protein [Clostridium]MBD8046972.1 hypothetical protein [Clostridium faecium]MDK0852506.1 DUF960 family protein [Clostridium perfringens]MDU3411043.1 DUF960 family protein [Clostridium sp.]MDU3522725.1 DUF960 family protein [Clostridium saudiense]MDZ4947819.1 hypothetical protein [Clostridium perfringens]